MRKFEIEDCISKCAERLNFLFENKKVVLVCILKGAVFFYVDLVRKLTMPYSCYFIGASSYSNGQNAGTVKISTLIEPSKFVGREIIIIDELYDNGHTLQAVKEALYKQVSVPSIFTCTLFWKDSKGSGPDLWGAIVPDVWLVGYGLDNNQEDRGLTDLWACPKEKGIPESKDDQIFTDINAYKQMRLKILEQLVW